MGKVNFKELVNVEKEKELGIEHDTPKESEAQAFSEAFDEVMEEPKKKVIDVTPNPNETFDLTVIDSTTDLTTMEHERPLTFEERKIQFKQKVDLVNFVAKNVLDESDWWLPPSAKNKCLTRSGYNKLAVAFSISTETLKIWVERELSLQGDKEDVVVYAKVKAIRPDGSFVIVTSERALSEYGRGASKMKMKDIKGFAETRAHNRAIANAIGFVPKGFSTVSKEEIDTEDFTEGFE